MFNRNVFDQHANSNVIGAYHPRRRYVRRRHHGGIFDEGMHGCAGLGSSDGVADVVYTDMTAVLSSRANAIRTTTKSDPSFAAKHARFNAALVSARALLDQGQPSTEHVSASTWNNFVAMYNRAMDTSAAEVIPAAAAASAATASRRPQPQQRQQTQQQRTPQRSDSEEPSQPPAPVGITQRLQQITQSDYFVPAVGGLAVAITAGVILAGKK